MADPIGEVSALTKAVQALGRAAEKTMGYLSTGVGGTSFSRGNLISNSLGMVGSVFSGAMGMMPNTQQVIQRAGSFYDASVMMGGVNRQRLTQATFNGLAGGLSAPGIDAMVASTLSTMGVGFSSDANSQYMRVVRAAGNATKYLNMDTNAAAAAVAGLNTGAMSSTLMRNFGVATSDRNGNPLTQGQIFEQMALRLTAGRGKASVQDTMSSLYRGALGASIQASGMTSDQQALFAQYMIERSKGVNMDLTDPKTMAKLQSQMTANGNENPFASGYSMNASSTAAMSAAESAYIQGLKNATPAVNDLNKASGELAKQFGALKTTIEAITGTAVGSGLLGMAGGVLSSAGNMLSGAGLSNAKTRLSGGGGAPASGPAGAVWAPGGKGGGGKWVDPKTGKPITSRSRGVSKLGKGAAGVSAVLGAINLGRDVASGQGWGTTQFSQDMGSSIGGTIGGIAGSLLDEFLGPLGTIGGQMIGSQIGGVIGGMFGTGGTKSTVGTGSSSTAATGTMDFMRPSNGPITAYYGEKGPMWGAEGHGGIDFGVPTGSPVAAAHDGVISYENSTAVGNVIKLTSPDKKFYTVYFHLSERLVPAGASVSRGTLIAKSGATGTQITGPHLHFGLFVNGARTNPAPYLGIGFSAQAISASTWGSQGSSVYSGGSAPSPSLITSTATGVQGNGSNPAAVKVSGAAASNSASKATTGVGGRGSGSKYLSNIRGASEGILNVTKDGPVNVHQGETILPVDAAKDYRKDQVFGKKHAQNNVTIHLTIGQASESEARKFAQRVKEYLEADNRIHSMGAQ